MMMMMMMSTETQLNYIYHFYIHPFTAVQIAILVSCWTALRSFVRCVPSQVQIQIAFVRLLYGVYVLLCNVYGVHVRCRDIAGRLQVTSEEEVEGKDVQRWHGRTSQLFPQNFLPQKYYTPFSAIQTPKNNTGPF